MDKEAPHATWVTAESRKEDEDTSVTSGVSQKSFGSSKAESDDGDDKPGKDVKQNIMVPGKPMRLSPMLGLQPCPFVFFRDGCGDVDSFRFLW
jgi:hypothetical protein